MDAMSHDQVIADSDRIWRSAPGFVLDSVDPNSTPGFTEDSKAGIAKQGKHKDALSKLQERLFASRTAGAQDAVLIILQGMDTAGKGGIVRHVVGALDPQGVTLASFAAPTAEELAHDFLWRVEPHLPTPGHIGVFDRSHYEDVLIGRVHQLAPAAEIERRYSAINEFEARIVAAGTRIIKVMLHISPEEQYARLAERLERPEKHWKYTPEDVNERMFWNEYQEAYQIMLERTSTEHAPWHVVPANAKWYARLAVHELLLNALTEIDPQWPAASYDVAAERRRLDASTPA